MWLNHQCIKFLECLRKQDYYCYYSSSSHYYTTEFSASCCTLDTMKPLKFPRKVEKNPNYGGKKGFLLATVIIQNNLYHDVLD